MASATIDALRESLHARYTPEYAAKQIHPVPHVPVVDRVKFLVDSADGKVILHLGASGPLHQALLKASPKVYGLDKVGGPGVVACDFDDFHTAIPVYPDVNLIIAGEILEHLSNPGWLLARLRRAYPSTRLVVTVPNAFTAAGAASIRQGIENVNIDHVAWYSYTTLTTLLKREGWIPEAFAWYHGAPFTAEGLIVVTEGDPTPTAPPA
jgi:hypothetical protein